MKKDMFLTREQCREIDSRAIKEYGIPGIVLMENAGRGTVDYLLSCQVQGRIVICCGKGNNAGDGFVVARHLDNLNFDVQVLIFAKLDELKGDAKVNYDIMVKSFIPITIVNVDNFQTAVSTILSADWIIDAIFGTGLQGPIHSPYDQVIQTINAADGIVLSIDIPSGLDCDTGIPLGIAVKADHTVTFVAYKQGFAKSEAKPYLGAIQVVDIGVPKVIFEL